MLRDGIPDYGSPTLQALIEQYRQMHIGEKTFAGGLHNDFVIEISDLVGRHLPKTMLDYGSGKGRQYIYKVRGEARHQYKAWDVLPHCYDPGVLAFSEKPTKQFDGVICTDVAEHIPPEDVPWFLADVISYAKKFVFFVIFVEPAKKSLPDGRNAHLTVERPTWWHSKLEAALLEVRPCEKFSHTVESFTPHDDGVLHIRGTLRGAGLEIVSLFRIPPERQKP
jgi:hypothetical protein